MFKVIKAMINGLFSKPINDLDGHAFKAKFESTENAVLFDVRTPAEFAGGTIPGAKNLDLFAPDFEQKIKKLNPQNTYFVFCRSGNRSRSALKLMEIMGLKVYNLANGIGAWSQ